MANATFKFYNNHQPALKDGTYTLSVSQTVAVKDNASPAITPDIQSQTLEFHVAGPRFVLDPSLVHSTYPPAGGKGDYRADLPSLVLNRSTLPWERSPVNQEIDSVSAPWLFLLLIDETEYSLVTEKPDGNGNSGGNMSDLLTCYYGGNTSKPVLNNEDIKHLPASFNYLEIGPPPTDGKGFDITAILPANLSDLQYLSYARIKETDGADGEEHAVLLCNRLPQAGHNSTVYLVSLENNYSGTDGSAAFKGIKNNNKNYVLPYLYKWQFHAFDEQLYCVTASVKEKLSKLITALPDLSSIQDHLYDNTSHFQAALSDMKITDTSTLQTIEKAAKLPGSTFHELLSHLTGGFAPYSTDPEAADITSSGTIKLAYDQLAKGTKGILPDPASAWLRGPLAAGTVDLTGVANFPLLTLTLRINSTFQLDNYSSGGTCTPADIVTIGPTGLVTGKKAGTCIISYSTADKTTLQINSTLQLDNYSSGGACTPEDIATISPTGLVTGKKAGTCVISYTATDKSKVTITITVTDKHINVTKTLTVTDKQINETPPKTVTSLLLKDHTNTEDTSYAAAFELGRLTALNDVDFSTEFYKWKSETAMAMRLNDLKSKPGYKNIMHLPLDDAAQILPIPQHVQDKFASWRNLVGLPYRYLVPDPALLPNESIRFFRVDNNWVNAFICGAFSIGHTVEADLSDHLKNQFLTGTVTGFLINSLAVSGWPHFMVDVEFEEGGSLLRKDNLDENIRLYLFEGSFTQLKFHLHPGKTHSGFLFENNVYTKGTATITPDSNNVVRISDLVKDLGSPPIAQFAAKMLEGVPTVVFTLNPTS